MDQQSRRELVLHDELRMSVDLIELGLGEIQHLSLANDFYYLPLQLLASGIEKFLKCHICLGKLEKSNSFPTQREIKKLNHNLKKLLDHVVGNYFNTSNKSLLESDLAFLLEDNYLQKLMSIMSEFGMSSRYYNLDYITSASKMPNDAIQEYKDLEDQIIRDKNFTNAFTNLNSQGEAFQVLNREIVIMIEKFIAAISRQFTMGNLGAKALEFSPLVHNYILLNEGELGKTDYRANKKKFVVANKSYHIRNETDEWERENYPDYHHVTVRKSDFEKPWPFYAEEVIVECRNKYWIVVSIDNCDYALNGAAGSKYKLEDLFEGGVAILGISIGPFINIGLELGKE